MADVGKAARDAIAEDEAGQGTVIRFSHCVIPGRGRPVGGYRWASTDSPAAVRFLLACWNNRHALAEIVEIERLKLGPVDAP